ncbi:MAG: DEAD/DEAH box helicase [Chlamydiia bacterium]|nr:DEAD/DEAH box helicase [Chlamydiia bacterium]
MFNITPEEAKEKFTTLSFKGKKLIADIFGRSEFFYIAEVKEDQTVNLSGVFKTKRKEIPVEEVDCIFEGPPCGFIKDTSLHFIGSDMTYRELKALPRTIDLDELQEIQEEAVDLILFGEEKIRKKTPVLILQDPFGITAKPLNPEDGSELLITDYQKTATGFQCRSDKVFESLSLLKAGGWVIKTKADQDVLLFEAFHADVDGNDDGLKLKGELVFEGKRVSLEVFRGERQLPLEENKVGLLPDTFKIHPALKVRIPRLKAGLLLDTVPPEKLPRDLFLPKIEIDPAPVFKGFLRPYQKEGLSWLNFLYQNQLSGFLADDMGLGKTVQTLAFLSRLPESSKILIVMPASLKFNWCQEIDTFLPSRKPQISLASYHEVRSRPDSFNDVYDALILDEAQAVKNKETLTFQAIKKLKSRFRLSISGTPIENRLEELKTHFHFLLPELELPNDPVLMKKIAAFFMLRRKKESVLKELPEKVETTVKVELFADERENYDRFLAEAKEKPLENQMVILEAILRLRQMACHAKLSGHPIKRSAKISLAISDIESLVLEDRAVLVFSQFTSLLSIVKEELEALGIDALSFTGETKNKEGVVDAFQSEAGPKVLLMSLKAGGVGLNLTKADTVLILDPWWNQAAEEQAIARAHRIGQKNTLFVKRYIAKDTIEEKVLELKAKKKNLADQIIDEGFEESSFNLEELQGLLA